MCSKYEISVVPWCTAFDFSYSFVPNYMSHSLSIRGARIFCVVFSGLAWNYVLSRSDKNMVPSSGAKVHVSTFEY